MSSLLTRSPGTQTIVPEIATWARGANRAAAAGQGQGQPPGSVDRAPGGLYRIHMRTSRIAGLLWLLAAAAALAGPPFSTAPDWVSTDVQSVSTGAALVDLDRDGWLDLVVSNGNDMARQPLLVYYNRCDGTFPDMPDWSSLSEEYHGHLSVGDVNQDGWPDVAVAVLLGPAGFDDPGWAALYLNDGHGNLPPTPSWTSADRFNTFTVVLGDADSDGDLDLAAAVGEHYHNPPDRNRVYYNQDGALDASPGWLSDELEHSMGAAWADADGDGDLDLVVAGTETPHRVYYQAGGALGTSSGWQSSTIPPITMRVGAGDLDRDGRTDLAFAENNQSRTEDGRFRLFPGTPAGPTPAEAWSSDYSGYGSETTIQDANADGWPDLLAGSWGQDRVYEAPLRIYANRYVRLPDPAPTWISQTGSVIERVVLGDVNNDGLRRATARFPGDGTTSLFQIERVPFRGVVRIVSDGVELTLEQYCCDPAAGWVSLAVAPATSLTIDYLYSTRLDIAVANWDWDQGNFLFYGEEPTLLRAGRGSTGTELRLWWSGGLPPFDVLETEDPSFGPGLLLRAEGLDVWEWEDLPGTIGQGTLTFYRVY